MVGDSFRDQFTHYVVAGAEVERLAFSAGLIVLDANVLLDVYRFAPRSRSELLSVIERLRSRIWIPHQVGEEFYRNRIEVMISLHNGYGALRVNVEKARDKLIEEVSEKINQLDNRVLLGDEKDRLLSSLKNALSPMLNEIEELQATHTIAGSYSSDPILAKVEQLLSGRVGTPFVEDLEDRLKEAQRRINAQEPPGYKDAEKKLHAHGDYFVWAQTLSRAKDIAAPVILLVTSDTKDDWYRKVHGQTISARTELVQEARQVANCDLILMNAAQFLKKAQKYTSIEVSAETIREAEVLPRLRETRTRAAELSMRLNEANADTKAAAISLHEAFVHLNRVQREKTVLLEQIQRADPGAVNADMALSANSDEVYRSIANTPRRRSSSPPAIERMIERGESGQSQAKEHIALLRARAAAADSELSEARERVATLRARAAVAEAELARLQDEAAQATSADQT